HGQSQPGKRYQDQAHAIAGIPHAEDQEPVEVEDDDAPEQAEDDGRRQRGLDAVAQREDHRYHGDARRGQQHSGHLDEPRALLRRLLQYGQVSAPERGHNVGRAPDHSAPPSGPSAGPSGSPYALRPVSWPSIAQAVDFWRR